MNRFETLPKELIGEIISQSDNLGEQLQMVISLPKGLEIYNQTRNDPEFWLKDIEEKTGLVIPKEYHKNVATLERFSTILIEALREGKNDGYSGKSLVYNLPEVLILISLVDNQWGNLVKYWVDEKKVKKLFYSLLTIYINIVLAVDPVLIQNLMDVIIVDDDNKKRRNKIRAYITIERILRATNTAGLVENYKKAIDLINANYPDYTRAALAGEIGLTFYSYKYIVEMMEHLRSLHYDTEFFILDSGIFYPVTRWIYKTEYIPELSCYIIDNFYSLKGKSFVTNHNEEISLNLILLLIVSSGFNSAIDDRLTNIVVPQNTIDQYKKFRDYLDDNVGNQRKIKCKEILDKALEELDNLGSDINNKLQ